MSDANQQDKPMNIRHLRQAYRFVLQDFQNLAPFFYLLLVGLGMIFQYQKYAMFGINIFEYASIFDYLIAPFNNPQIMLFTVGSLLFCVLVAMSNQWMAKRFNRLYTWMWFGLNKKSWFNPFAYVSFFVLVVVYVWVASLVYAIFSHKSFNASEVIEVVFADGESKQGKLIGKTQSYLFLHADEHIEVVPVTAAVKRLVLKEPEMLQEKIQVEQKKAK